MPSAPTLPTFSDEEILTYESLNALSQAISARFTAGVGAADLAWPLTAEGNLDLSVYNLVGGRQIWGIVNAGNYDTLTAAISAAGANGVVLVPPETTVGAAAAGHALPNAVSIIGSGVSSVIQMDASASADMLRVTGGTGGMLANLTLDGNSVAGAHSGASLTGATNYAVRNVWTKNFTGAGLEITSGMVSLTIDGFYDTGSAYGLTCTGCQNLIIGGVRLKNYTTRGMDFNGGGSTLRAHVSDVHTETTGGGAGIYFVGNGSVGVGSGAEFNGSNIHIKGATGSVDGMVLGSSAAALDRVNLSNVTVEDATANALTVNAGQGTITGCVFDSPTTTGLDLDTSTNVNVSGCAFANATNGIDMSDAGCDGCVVSDNSYASVTNPVLRGDNTSVERGNAQLSAGIEQGMFIIHDGSSGNAINSGSGSEDHDAFSMTIPANLLRTGDMLQCEVTATQNGNSRTHSIRVRLNGQNCLFQAAPGAGGVQHYLFGTIMLKSATTASSLYHGQGNDGATTGNDFTNSITGLDTTSDQTINVRVTTDAGSVASDGVVFKSFVVKIIRGANYS